MTSAKLTGKAAGLPDIRVAAYPGAIAIDSAVQIEKNIRETVFPQIIKLLTELVKPAVTIKKNVKKHLYAFEGTFEEVNEIFALKQWTDGLPIVPPTDEKVEQFLKYTNHDPADVIGQLPPSLCPATVKTVAINGVMAGCKPEYMPILIAVVEAVADPHFHLEDAGSSAGWATMIILNGPAIKRLEFNYSTAVLRVGSQANTSVSRFLRLCLRNIAGFMPGTTDMASYGRPEWPVLAENEEESPWEPLSVTRGFPDGDSVITVNSVGHMSFMLTVTATTPEGILKNIAAKVRLNLLAGDGSTIMKHGEMAPILGLSPSIANTLAQAGYSKQDVKEYIYQHSQVTAAEFDEWLALQAKPDSCECVKRGLLPEHFHVSDDPNRMLPLYHNADELQIVVAGTKDRNRFFVAEQVGRQGLVTSKCIDMTMLE